MNRSYCRTWHETLAKRKRESQTEINEQWMEKDTLSNLSRLAE